MSALLPSLLLLLAAAAQLAASSSQQVDCAALGFTGLSLCSDCAELGTFVKDEGRWAARPGVGSNSP